MTYQEFPLIALVFASACCLPAQNYKIVSANSGKVLDVQNGATGLGALIQQWDWLGGANQQWQIVPLGNGYNEIRNVNSGKVLDVINFSTNDGAGIQQYDWLNGPNQQWQIIPQDSSWNSIVNLNSGKVLDVTGVSLDNGALLQQWEWLQGLNQQWEIVPVQDTYQMTGYTSILYNPNTNVMSVLSSWDTDYNTEYYYGGRIVTTVYDNGAWIKSGEIDPNDSEAIADFDALLVGVGVVNGGDYYEAHSTFYGITEYQWYQVILGCGPYCDPWYDPYNYDFVERNPEGTQIPTWTTTVWAPIIVETIARIGKSIVLGQNSAGMRVPGTGGIFDLKVRAFIAPAWVKGAGYPADFCIDSNGSTHNVIYQGDNRSYDPFSDRYRMNSEVIVSTLSDSAIGTPVFQAGTTTRYSDDALSVDGYTLKMDSIYGDCHLTDAVVQGTIQAFDNVNGGGGTVRAELRGDATNEATTFPQYTPSITWDFTYAINVSNPAAPTYTLTYTHDCYPAFEVYIGAQRVYGVTPTDNQAPHIGLCLAGVNQIQGSTPPQPINYWYVTENTWQGSFKHCVAFCGCTTRITADSRLGENLRRCGGPRPRYEQPCQGSNV